MFLSSPFSKLLRQVLTQSTCTCFSFGLCMQYLHVPVGFLNFIGREGLRRSLKTLSVYILLPKIMLLLTNTTKPLLPIPYALSIQVLHIGKVYFPFPSISLAPILSFLFHQVVFFTMTICVALLLKKCTKECVNTPHSLSYGSLVREQLYCFFLHYSIHHLFPSPLHPIRLRV